MKPKCTIQRDWGDKRKCGKDAIHRNRFGGFECPEHYEMPRGSQPDSFFNKGTLKEEIHADTWWGLIQLHVAYTFYKLFRIKLWKKAT